MARSPSARPRLPGSAWAWLGPTWAAAPWRRAIQCVCLGLFLGLLFHVAWPYGSPDYADTLRAKELLPVETFLLLDPLVSLSAALAAKAWMAALLWAAALLGLSWFFPRAFCGYLCPLGTLIDGFDWALRRCGGTPRRPNRGGWVHVKYYLLLGMLVAALGGVLATGFVAAMPVLTRGLQFLLGPVQIGLLKGWYLAPAWRLEHALSLLLFGAVFGLSLLGPRFWCRYVCPTGAVFSVANLLRGRERRVGGACIECGRCVASCPFDAIQADYSTRVADCTVCQTCAGVCPTDAIAFVGRWRAPEVRVSTVPAEAGVALSRRGFLLGALGGAACAFGGRRVVGASRGGPATAWPVRPPGSVPEAEFLQRCIRCAACFQVCPNNALQPVGFQSGLEGWWTPQLVARWSGCEPRCNNCGQVCPTGAIRPLPLEEKRVARLGLAVVNVSTCLPHARREACQLCVDECKAAGYDALEFRNVGTQVDAQGQPIEGSGFLAPVVLAEQCVGCGLCETRCARINVSHKRLLAESAIQVLAGPGREDRLREGSYRVLRAAEERARQRERERALERAPRPRGPGAAGSPGDDGYLPGFLQP